MADRKDELDRLKLLHETYEQFEELDGPAIMVVRRNQHGQMTATAGPTPIHGRVDPNNLDAAA